MKRHAPRLRKGELAAMTPEAREAHLKAQANRYYNQRYKKRFPKDDPEGYQTCRGCGKQLPATREHFFKNHTARDGLSSRCKVCLKDYGRAYRVRNEYQLTHEEYKTIMGNAACAICGVAEKLVLDHCHDKGHIRGVLCANCNTGLGMYCDDPNRLQSAIDYLARTRNGL